MKPSANIRPDWDRLFNISSEQDGLFTTAQAAEAGYSPQLLVHHLRAGRIIRVRRGIYRLVHYPYTDHEDLTSIWLWSERKGVFSHETALALHQLSDALPAKIHLTLPIEWKSRRLRVPANVLLYFSDTKDELTWIGAVQVTSARRTVIDCAGVGVAPEIIAQAIKAGLLRGLFTKEMVQPGVEYLKTFGMGIE